MRNDFKLINASTLTPHLNPLPLRNGRGDREPAHYDILIASGLNQQSRIITTSRSGSLMDLLRHGLPGHALMWDCRCSPFDLMSRSNNLSRLGRRRIHTSV